MQRRPDVWSVLVPNTAVARGTMYWIHLRCYRRKIRACISRNVPCTHVVHEHGIHGTRACTRRVQPARSCPRVYLHVRVALSFACVGSMRACVYTVCHLASEQSPLGIRHPWFLKPWAVVPYPLPAPLCISLHPTHNLPPWAQRPSFLSRPPSTFTAFTLTLPLSLSLSLFLSHSLCGSTPSILYLCFSFPRAAPACCQFCLSPSAAPTAPGWSPLPPSCSVPSSVRRPLFSLMGLPLLTAHGRPRPSCVPLARQHAAPSQKTQVQCRRNGGFLPSPSFTLFPSYVVPPSPPPLSPAEHRSTAPPSSAPVSVPLPSQVSSCSIPWSDRSVLSWLPFLLFLAFSDGFFFSPSLYLSYADTLTFLLSRCLSFGLLGSDSQPTSVDDSRSRSFHQRTRLFSLWENVLGSIRWPRAQGARYVVRYRWQMNCVIVQGNQGLVLLCYEASYRK